MNPAMAKVACPITRQGKVEFINTYSPSITSDNRLVQAPVENWLSLATGLVFNATGARGGEREFYQDEYDFVSENAESELLIFKDERALGMYDQVVNFIERGVSLGSAGRILDVGCGKGLLLKRFLQRHPGWRIFGIEQSRNALRLLPANIPNAHIFEGLLHDSPFASERFELITANGVLEHVPDPLGFLASCREALADDGVLYIGVPNFATNPTDLFTFDHLSRFTPTTLRTLFSAAGLRVRSAWVLETQVPMWYLLEPNVPQKEFDSEFLVNDSRKHIQAALSFVASTFAAYDQCVYDAGSNKGRIALYGLGAIGILGTAYSALTSEHIDCLVDDNTYFWGTKKHGIEVVAPEELAQRGITHVAIAANPCNIAKIRRRLSALDDNGMTFYHA